MRRGAGRNGEFVNPPGVAARRPDVVQVLAKYSTPLQQMWCSVVGFSRTSGMRRLANDGPLRDAEKNQLRPGELLRACRRCHVRKSYLTAERCVRGNACASADLRSVARLNAAYNLPKPAGMKGPRCNNHARDYTDRYARL